MSLIKLHHGEHAHHVGRTALVVSEPIPRWVCVLAALDDLWRRWRLAITRNPRKLLRLGLAHHVIAPAQGEPGERLGRMGDRVPLVGAEGERPRLHDSIPAGDPVARPRWPRLPFGGSR